MSTTVHVSNIAADTSEHEVKDFFSFCGKITSLSVTPSSADPNAPKSATVTFEKETAAKTALLLDNTQLGPSQVKVEAAHSLDDLASSKPSTSTSAAEGGAKGGDSGDEIQQEDKPRSRILAEYIAHGYAIGDKTIQRAIELDSKHGISNRFTSALQNFDTKFHATDRAKTMDASYGVTDKAGAGWRGIQSYFEKALGTPTGQRLVAFYTQTEKQVRDIHNEARRLAELRKQEQGQGQGGSGSGDQKVSQIPGTDKTVCTCSGDQGHCPCEPGKCACQGCAKSSVSGSAAGNTATGPAPDIAAATHLQPMGSNYPHEATGPAADIADKSGVAPMGEKY